MSESLKTPEAEPAVVHMPVDSETTATEAAGPVAPFPLGATVGGKGKRRRREPDPPPTPTPLEMALAGAKGSAREAMKTHGRGRNDKGTFKADVVARPVRSRAKERLPQLVKHVSEAVLALSKGAEIEGMWVRGTLVVAGNTSDQLATVMARIAKAVDDHQIAADTDMLHQLLALVAPGGDRRFKKTMEKLGNVEAGVRGNGWTVGNESAPDLTEADLLHEVLVSSPLPSLVMDIDDARSALEAQTHSVVFLHEDKVHAEQQLVRLLSTSSFRGERAVIRGTKRPCYGCYLALEYAAKFQGCVGLDHGVRPGGLWMNSVDTALEHISAVPGGGHDSAEATRWAEARIRGFGAQAQHKSELKSGAVVGDEDSESESDADDDL